MQLYLQKNPKQGTLNLLFPLSAARRSLLNCFCNALIRREGSVLQFFVSAGAFYASTWPGVNRQFRNRCSTTLQILVFTRENSTKESVNTFLPDWQTRLVHLHWIRPNGHLSSITDALKSLCFVSVNYEWFIHVMSDGKFIFLRIRLKKEKRRMKRK